MNAHYGPSVNVLAVALCRLDAVEASKYLDLCVLQVIWFGYRKREQKSLALLHASVWTRNVTEFCRAWCLVDAIRMYHLHLTNLLLASTW